MKRTITLSVAAVMISQSVALAQVDRTAEVADQAIAQAQQNISTLRVNLQSLDSALAETAATIEARDNSGGITNGITIAGAAVGLGLSALTYFTAHTGREGSGIGAMVGLATSLVATITSIVTGTGSAVLKEDIDTAAIDKQLEALEKEIAANSQGQSKETSALLIQLSASVSGMRSSLQAYQKDEDGTDRTKLMAHISQGLGTALLFYSATQRNASNKTILVGGLLLSAGNLTRIVAGMSDSQAEMVLKEIKSTRTSLRTAAMILE
ncbi:hypothetical protein [Bdellovibrio bacteriovorus]|uniref:hypothetical protein n=1 Tax=Bdellovibrio bacteriovorus TaxID=959 RepID=UPI00045BF1EC|nr:hypothetical protein [Bdellovibrio bacteriovorus]AHZ84303.1 hypothetical protein EP01_05045 [Bdellovibrio bacteriovorus]BEV68191.1 hypothetical protein Bb109J_c1611 [Bdellovibrio bacteriovorus]